MRQLGTGPDLTDARLLLAPTIEITGYALSSARCDEPDQQMRQSGGNAVKSTTATASATITSVLPQP
jgi:hypothetical protein